ncbi:MAG: anaerobic sulfatase maturase [Armatimonadota bacterium]|nr:anaerobic sulfatase maturase [Armatimonadota bacterium]
MSHLSLLVKPVGADCNLRCSYCFYRPKAALYPEAKHPRMENRVLERLISDAMGQRADSTTFGWQGGEPALAGLDFYRLVVQLQMAYGARGQGVGNSLQTNGTLLNAEWARFLREYNFLVGLSIDGPADLHNKYRRDRQGAPTYSQVMDTMRLLRLYEVEFNALVLVNNHNVRKPVVLYEFLRDNGVTFMQFVPCVEPGPEGKPAPYSITPSAYGDFLCGLFDAWLEDYPDVSVRDFDQLLLTSLNRPGCICMHGQSCDHYLVVEHNGDVYPCDFFVLPDLRLGNVMENTLEELGNVQLRSEFAAGKSDHGPKCLQCEWLNYCRGGCIKHRTVLGGEVGDPSYFCESYRQLNAHSMGTIRELAARIGSE